jgi:hypothetical protein
MAGTRRHKAQREMAAVDADMAGALGTKTATGFKDAR